MAPGQPSTSGSTSRIQAIVFTTLDGYVIYEAYYEQLNDVQKCEIRTSFDTISAGHQLTHGTELVGRFKNGRIAGLVCGSVVAYALGTGYCDELMLVTFLEPVFEALVDVLDVEEVKGRPAMDGGLLMGQYEVLAHVVDGACVEGIVDEVGVGLRKGLQLGSEKFTSRGGKGSLRSMVNGIKGIKGIKSMKGVKSAIHR